MYHFTDVPMLVSNESFLILDPQQRVLPKVYHEYRKRRIGMKMPLSATNRHAIDQLVPSVGLYGFQKETDHYPGTLFRFPLRLRGLQTSLKETHETVDFSMVESQLDKYFPTARIALLFLRHVSLIEFHIRGRPDPQWTVSAQRFHDGEDTYQRIEITTCRDFGETKIDTWCVALKAIPHLPGGVVRSGRGSKKLTQCGIAACLADGQNSQLKREDHIRLSFQPLAITALSGRGSALQQKVFCRLPTIHESNLPISFHGSFAITGDRRNIALDPAAENSAWNLWLLEECLPALYLKIVQFLSPRLGQDVFKFWPAKNQSNSLSGHLAKAFWRRLADQYASQLSMLPLVLPPVQLDDGNMTRPIDRSHRTTDPRAATFDFLPLFRFAYAPAIAIETRSTDCSTSREIVV